MKMAKASNKEWTKAMDFANALSNEQDYPKMTDAQIITFVRNAPYLVRVVFGYSVLVDNCCDPNSDTLEFKPEIAALMEKAEAAAATAA